MGGEEGGARERGRSEIQSEREIDRRLSSMRACVQWDKLTYECVKWDKLTYECVKWDKLTYECEIDTRLSSLRISFTLCS